MKRTSHQQPKCRITSVQGVGRCTRILALAMAVCGLSFVFAAPAQAQTWKRVGTVSTLTANQMCKTDGTLIICDTTSPTISSGLLGIGTTTPLSALSVNGGAAIGSYAGLNAAPSNGLIVSGIVGIGTASPNANVALDLGNTSSAIILPKGSVMASPVAGMMRYNTSTSSFEGYDGVGWYDFGGLQGTFDKGTAAAPGWAVSTDTASGLYQATSTTLSVTAGGTEAARFLKNAGGAVNYVTITGSPTGNPVVISVAGADTNASLRFDAKGTAGIALASRGNYALVTQNSTNSAVNWAYISGSGTGSAIALGASGSDTNISINIVPKGTGGIQLNGSNAISFPADTGSLAIGPGALTVSATGASNVGIGQNVLANTTGDSNVAVGNNAGNALTTGYRNVFIGRDAGALDVGGVQNVAIGRWALNATTGMSGATAVGYTSMQNCTNTGAAGNSAFGSASLAGASGQTCGDSNSVFGDTAGAAMSTGFKNTLMGRWAGDTISSGNWNTIIGANSGILISTGGGNTILGGAVASTTLATGSNNILIGVGVGTSAGGADTPASGTSNFLNIGNTLEGNMANANAVGGETLYLNSVASSVNYVQIAGGATGANPAISANGTDTNISLVLTPKGTGSVGIGTAAPAAMLHTLATTEQMRLGYDATHYTSFTTGSGGSITIAPSATSGVNLYAGTGTSTNGWAVGGTDVRGVLTVQKSMTTPVYAANTDMTDSGRPFVMENTDASATVNQFSNITLQVAPTLGFSGAGRVLGDIRLVRQTANQTNSFFMLSAFREGGGYKDFAKIGYDTSYFVGTLGVGTTSVSTGVALDLGSNTNSVLLPKGTTGQEPTGIAGMLRYNTTTSSFEGYDGVGWYDLGGAVGTFDPGTVSAPGFAVSSDTASGLYQATASTISVTAGGTEAARFLKTPSAVNYPTITGATTGNAPIFAAAGTDTNVGLIFQGKGSGGIIFQSNGSNVATFTNSSSSYVDSFNFGGGSVGSSIAPSLSVTGTDTNISMSLATKGTGLYYFSTGNGVQAEIVDNGATAVNYLTMKGAATGANPNIAVAGTDTNISLNLTPKGTGTVIVKAPSGSSTFLDVQAPTASNSQANISFSNPSGYMIKWYLGKDQNENFYVYDQVNGGSAILVSPAGLAQFGESQQLSLPRAGGVGIGTATMGTNATLAVNGGLSVGTYANTATTAVSNGLIVSGVVGIGTSTITAGTVLDLSNNNSSIILPKGNTAQEPGTPIAGMVRYNTTNSSFEGYDGTGWYDFGGVAGTFDKGTVSAPGWAVSTDTTSGLYQSATASTISIAAGGKEAGRFLQGTGTVVNYPTFTGAATGANPIIAAAGTDTNISLSLTPKGTGNLNLTTGSFLLAGNNGISVPSVDTTSLAIGSSALAALNTATTYNFAAGLNALKLDTSGIRNLAIGYNSLAANTTGNYNLGVGYLTLTSNTTGAGNTAVGGCCIYGGEASMQLNTTGNNNTALGASSMTYNTTGSGNTGLGYAALFFSGTGSNNTAVGNSAFYSVGSGTDNTGLGANIDKFCSNCTGNTALGSGALYANSTGNGNTVIGVQSGYTLTTGSYNTFLGYGVGYGTIATGSSNIMIGVGGGNTAGGSDTPASGTSNYLNIGNTLEGNMVNANAVGRETLYLNSVSNSVNYVQMSGGATGTGPTIQSNGTDTNIALTLNTVGTGALNLKTAGSGNVTITPTSGNTNISAGKVGIGSASPQASLDLSQQTDAIALPTGTTGQRPTATPGMIRYNSTVPQLEAYYSGGWNALAASAGLSSISLGTSVTVPNPYASGSDTQTGLYTAGSGKVDVTISGTQKAEFNASGLGIGTATLGTNATLAVNGGLAVGTYANTATTAVSNGLVVSGNVGIGTSSPSYVLDVTGSVRAGANVANNFVLAGTASGGWPVLTATGTDTNVGMNMVGKGSGGLVIQNAAGGNLLQIGSLATASTNYVNISPNSAGNYAGIAAQGTDTNTGIRMSSKGTGKLVFTTNATDQMTIDGSGNVGIGTTQPNANAVLDMGNTTTSMIVPRGPTEPGSPTAGMMRYNTATSTFEGYDGTGWYDFGGALGTFDKGTAAAPGWAVTQDTTSGLFQSATTTTLSIAAGGKEAGRFLQGTGTVVNYPTFTGAATGANPIIAAAGTDTNISLNLTSKGTGAVNITNSTAGIQIGGSNGISEPIDVSNLAIGGAALGSSGLSGSNRGDTAIGNSALFENTTGSGNTAVGYNVMFNNTTGSSNIGIGGSAASTISSGSGANYVTKGAALLELTIGTQNVAVGQTSLASVMAGNSNTAVGNAAGSSIGSGSSNTAVGNGALSGAGAPSSVISGGYNTALGNTALLTLSNAAASNTAVGNAAGSALTTGSSNLILGSSVASTTLNTGSSNILIGVNAVGNAGGADTPANNTSNYLNIGNTLEGDMTNANAIGKETLYLQSAANSVNYIQITGAATTNYPTITATGTDTNVALNLTTKGAGSVIINPTSSANGLTLTSTGNDTLYLYTNMGTGSWNPIVQSGDQALIFRGTTNGNSNSGGFTIAPWNNSSIGLRMTYQGYVGLDTATPLSALDVNGGVAVGSYAGASAAPSNGMIVSGAVGIGTATIGTNAKLAVNGGLAVGTYANTATTAVSNGLIVSGAVGIGTSSPNANAVLDMGNTTTSMIVPMGPTEPASPTAGMMRYNTATSTFEGYDGTGWYDFGGALGTFDKGTAAAPGWAVTQDTTSGLFQSATTTTLSIAAGGKEAGRFLQGTGTVVNYPTFTGAATGANPIIAAAGTDTNVSLVLTPKGTGGVAIGATTASGYALNVNSSTTYTLANFEATGDGWIYVRSDTTCCGGGRAGIQLLGNNAGNPWILEATDTGSLTFLPNGNVNGTNSVFRATSVGNFMLGNNAANQSVATLGVMDNTATTGATKTMIQAGQGQSTTNLFEVRGYNATFGSGTLQDFVSSSGAIGIGTSALGANATLAVNGGLAVGTYANTATTAVSNGLIVSGAVGIGTSTIIAGTVLDLSNNTSSIILPKGNTAQEPGTPIAGMVRYNTTNSSFEGYDGVGWYDFGGVAGTFDKGTVAAPGWAVSTDTASGLYQSATSSTISIAAGGKEAGRFLQGSGAVVNYPTFAGAATGANPIIAAAGADTNVSLVLMPKGTGGVGIGTTSPATTLQVNGEGNLNSLQIGSIVSGVTIGNYNAVEAIHAGANENMLFTGPAHAATGNAIYSLDDSRNVVPFEIKAGTLILGMDGNVGIGTTSPSTPLHVVGAATLNGQVNVVGAGGSFVMRASVNPEFDFYNSSGSQKGFFLYNPSSDLLSWHFYATTYGEYGIDLNTDGTINIGGLKAIFNGPVGIGTSTLGTNAKLAVNGGLAVGSYANTATTAVSNGLIVSGAVGIGTSTITAGTVLDLSNNNSSIILPKGNTAQEPGTPIAGMVRYNTTNSSFEGYDGSGWYDFGGVAGTFDKGTVAAPGWAVSTDTASGLFQSATSSTISIAAGGKEAGRFLQGTGTVVNYPTFAGAATGANPIIAAAGTDTNITLNLTSKGTGAINISSASTGLQLGGVNGINYPSGDTTSGASIAIGVSALANETAAGSAAYQNTALGYQAMGNGTLTTAAVQNTAVGYQALAANTSGDSNVAVGRAALAANTTGARSTAVGNGALVLGTGGNNVAVGWAALPAAVTGNSNVAVGGHALLGDLGGSNNTAVGFSAGTQITTGGSNVVIGANVAQTTLATGAFNILVGGDSTTDTYSSSTSTSVGIGQFVKPGTRDIAIGYGALGATNADSNGNVAIGYQAGTNTTSSGQVFIGKQAGMNLTSGSQAVAIGANAMGRGGTNTGPNNTCVGLFCMGYLTGAAQGNTGFGSGALLASSFSGSYNTTIGWQSGYAVTTGSNNVIVGINSGGSNLTTGSYNVILGNNVATSTLVSGNSNILIGTSGVVDTPAAGTSYNLNIGNLLQGDMTNSTSTYNKTLYLQSTASGVNYMQIAGGATGANPVISAAGTDTNIGLTLTPKGTGNTIISNGSVGIGTTTLGTNAVLAVNGGLAVGTYANTAKTAVSNGLIVSGAVGIGTSTIIAGTVLDLSNNTSSIILPTGNTAQEPGTPIAGMVRYNTTNSSFEGYDGTGWYDFGGVAGTFDKGTVSAPGWAVSTDTASGLYQSATSSTISIAAGGKEAGRFLQGTGTVVNYPTFAGAATGANPIIAAAGTDTNISLTIAPKGTGNTIVSSGFVGIGTTTPASMLDIETNAAGYGTSGFQLYTRHAQGIANFGLVNSAGNDVQFFAGSPSQTARNMYGLGTGAVADLTANGFNSLAFGTFNAAPVILATSNTERIRILSGGNVGIGTATPQATLDVNGFAKLKLNSSLPVACAVSTQGSLALTHLARLCVCDSTNIWSDVVSGGACSW